MKNLIIISALLISIQAMGQDRYYTRNGNISFYSEAPLENIEATNNQVAAYIMYPKGTISFAVLINSFEFEKALMQEHFNENYMESNKYPKATFKGSFVDGQIPNPAVDGEHSVKINGDLTIRGITKIVETTALLKIEQGTIYATCEFNVQPVDFNVTIPAAVRDNIAKNVLVKVDVSLKKFESK